jgi:hypothetical protein
VWEPEPHWRRLAGGRGPFDVGVWTAEWDGRAWVVKRVRAPGPDDPAAAHDSRHPAYWRREAEAALHLRPAAGLLAPDTVRVDEDAEGYTLWTARVDRGVVTALFAAHALGRFAATSLPDLPWLTQRLLRHRLAAAEARHGWPTLATTPAAELARSLWERRTDLLDRYDALPQRPAHGDAVPGNLLAPRGTDVVAVAWGSVGLAPAGADLGFFALSCREDFTVLLETYLDGLGGGGSADLAVAEVAARVMAVYTVLGRAEWALARVASAPGELAGKFRHPAVAPYLRALQRRLPEIDALLA